MNRLRLQNTFSWLDSDEDDLKTLLWKSLRHRRRGYFHSTLYKQKKWDGYDEFFIKNSGRFLTGLLPEVELALDHLKRPFTVADERGSVEFLHKDIDDTFLQRWQPEGAERITLHDYQVDYINQIARLKRGIILSPTGCHRKGQGILMFDGSIKKVEDVEIGDRLMGPDSTPRTVSQLCHGRDQMYEIVPTSGRPFVVNGDHVLSLVRTNEGKKTGRRPNEIVNVSVMEWLTWSKTRKHVHKIYRVGVDFQGATSLPISPYHLGMLLGDGCITGRATATMTTEDFELIEASRSLASSMGVLCKVRKEKRKEHLSIITFPHPDGFRQKRGSNRLKSVLRDLELWGTNSGTKFIPQAYKVATRSDRLELLAGLMDTDGTGDGGCGFDYISKSYRLARDVAFVARSLGFACYLRRCKKRCQTGYVGSYYRLSISGDLSVVPCRINRKIRAIRAQKKNHLRTGFTAKPLGVENYFGFQIDKDNLYLLSDFTVTHNSGKTLSMVGILKSLPPGTPTLILTKSVDLTRQLYNDIEPWGIEGLGKVIGGAKKDFKPGLVTVANVDSVHKIANLLAYFRALIVDEVHLMMSNIPKQVYKRMERASIRVGMSATPFKFGSTDPCQKYETKGYFGPVVRTQGRILSTQELQDRGILSRSRCTFYPITQPELPYETYGDAVTLGIAENLHFNQIVAKIAQAQKGRTLILVERIKHGELLASLIPGSQFIYGQDTAEARLRCIKLLQESDQCVCIVQQQLISAGINVFIHSLIAASGGSATHNVIQRMGRGLRNAEDKELLQYTDFVFYNNDYLYSHSMHRMKVLASEGHEVIEADAIET